MQQTQPPLSPRPPPLPTCVAASTSSHYFPIQYLACQLIIIWIRFVSFGIQAAVAFSRLDRVICCTRRKPTRAYTTLRPAGSSGWRVKYTSSSCLRARVGPKIFCYVSRRASWLEAGGRAGGGPRHSRTGQPDRGGPSRRAAGSGKARRQGLARRLASRPARARRREPSICGHGHATHPGANVITPESRAVVARPKWADEGRAHYPHDGAHGRAGGQMSSRGRAAIPLTLAAGAISLRARGHGSTTCGRLREPNGPHRSIKATAPAPKGARARRNRCQAAKGCGPGDKAARPGGEAARRPTITCDGAPRAAGPAHAGKPDKIEMSGAGARP